MNSNEWEKGYAEGFNNTNNGVFLKQTDEIVYFFILYVQIYVLFIYKMLIFKEM